MPPVRAADAARQLVEHACDLLSTHAPDGTYRYVSPSCRALLGYEPEELVGTHAYAHFHPEDAELIALTSHAVILSVEEVAPVTYRIRCKDGRYVWFETVSRAVHDAAGNVSEIVAVSRDVSRRREAEDAALVGMATLSLDGRFLQVNRTLCELAGRSRSDLLQSTIADVTHPDHRDADAVALVVVHEEQRGRQYETRFLRPDGSSPWVLVNAAVGTAGSGRAACVLMQVVDVTARKAYEDQLARLALFDTLTGLPNRTWLLDRLDDALRQTADRTREVAVVHVDLDEFGETNDAFGHAVGDAVLQRVGERLQQVAAPDARVARLGGDEFVLFTETCDGRAEGVRLAERIAETLTAPIWIDDHELVVCSSIGVAIGGHPSDAETILRRARTATDRVKARGGGHWTLADDTLHRQARERLRLRVDLQRAIERNELRVLYQPVVDVASRITTSVEALVRWQHPERGLLGPAEFIPFAEESGLIVALGSWVLREACRQLAQWQRDAGNARLAVAVNLSARQLTDPGVVATVEHAIADAAIDPACLYLEITESALLHDPAVAEATLCELRGLGVRTALDDFGTGYSSLGYLKHLPVDTVKIDRTFVDGVPSSSDDAALVTAIIAMAHALGLSATAEGVTSLEHHIGLRALRCDHAQGYYFARPLSPDDVPGVLGLPLPLDERRGGAG